MKNGKNGLTVRFTLLEIENPSIHNEINKSMQQGLKAGDVVKLMLLELAYNRELISVLRDNVVPHKPIEKNEIRQTGSPLDLLD